MAHPGAQQPSHNGREVPEHAFDVYARPFVPEELRSINIQPATVLNTLPGRTIDCDAYARHFIPPLFLQSRPNDQFLDQKRIDYEILYTNQPVPLSAETHAIFFCDAFREERRALKRDIANYALYKVHMDVYHQYNGAAHCVLHVPGIRENNPRIELEDLVSIRQLVTSGSWNGMLQVGCTGIMYNTRVHLIDRAKELVTLRTDHGHTLMPINMGFNVCFNSPLGWIEAQRLSLALIQDSLDYGAPTLANGNSKTHHTANGGRERAEADAEISEQGQASWIRRMLFPEDSDGALQTQLTLLAKRKLFDKELNFEQQKAVDSVCRHHYGEVPFLISGPPGTGKTKTIVECVLQLVSNDSQISHILLCAPSDPAADTLAQRLSQHLDFGDFIRLNAPTRTFAEVPESLMAHCFIENDQFALPGHSLLTKYRVVVTSCKDAAMLVSARLTNKDLFALEHGVATTLHHGHAPGKMALYWSALIVDEAAQATEPEAAIPISVVTPPEVREAITSNPIFVMAGDQMQLGPRAKAEALKTSLFERLFNRALYRDHPLARNKTTPGAPSKPLDRTMLPITRPPFANLIRNYRSHPAILAVPSALFYHDTLIPEASGTDALHAWTGWQGRGWPVLFKTNTSPDEMEGEGGGWYNVAEAQAACASAASLVRSGLVDQRDICMTSPFGAQVRLLRSTMRGEPYGMWRVNIGPTEAFQGLESRVVILCTTRTRKRFLAQDGARGAGIVHEHRRFNVALTRAKEGLVVIGNPHVLAVDPAWAAFLDLCRRHGLWEDDASDGCRHPGVSLGPGPATGGAASGEWQAADSGAHVSTLETGLVTKEQLRLDGTADYARFMAAGTGEAMWIDGMLAALAIDEADDDPFEEEQADGVTRSAVEGEQSSA